MFITFEGTEGVGKTTQIRAMASIFEKAGKTVLITREPGGTPMGEEIRDILLAHRHERVAPMTELLLMFAARAQHVDTVIKPALARGEWVICDRFVDATYAYQGGGRQVPETQISALEKLVLNDFQADFTIILDAPVKIGLERVKGRGTHPDRFEQEKLDFFEKVRAVYLKRAKNQSRYKVVDASQSLEAVELVITHMAEEILKIGSNHNHSINRVENSG